MEDGKNSIENEEVYIFILGMEKQEKQVLFQDIQEKPFLKNINPLYQ